MKDRDYLTRIVESGVKEPTAAELERKQADILQKLRAVTPDQLKEFRGRALEADRAAEIKIGWEKTVWAK